MAGAGVGPNSFDSSVRRATDCATRPDSFLYRKDTSQLAKVYRATSGPTHYSIAARWWLSSTALWRGCNSADDGSDVALTPTDRRRPANGSTYCMFFNKQLNYFIYIFFHVNYSSTVHLRDWVGPCWKGRAFANFVHMLTIKIPNKRRLSI